MNVLGVILVLFAGNLMTGEIYIKPACATLKIYRTLFYGTLKNSKMFDARSVLETLMLELLEISKLDYARISMLDACLKLKKWYSTQH